MARRSGTSRYVVAFLSVLVGVAVAAPFAVLKFGDLAPIPPPPGNAAPRELTFQELLVICECCVVFYAGTYLTGRRLYAAFGTVEDLEAVRELSGTHMRLLHSFGGVLMVAAAMLDQPAGNKNLISAFLSITIGLAMLCSGFWALVRWAFEKWTRRNRLNSGGSS